MQGREDHDLTPRRTVNHRIDGVAKACHTGHCVQGDRRINDAGFDLAQNGTHIGNIRA